MKTKVLNIILAIASLVVGILTYRKKKELEELESFPKLKNAEGKTISYKDTLKSLRSIWKIEREKALKNWLTEDKAIGTKEDDTGGWAKDIYDTAQRNGTTFESEVQKALDWLWEHGEEKAIFVKQRPVSGASKAEREQFNRKRIHQGFNDWTYKMLMINLKNKGLIDSYSINNIEKNKELINLLELV